MTQGGYQVIIILPIKSRMAASKKQCFFVISVYKGMFINTLVGGLENLVGGQKSFDAPKRGGQKSF